MPGKKGAKWRIKAIENLPDGPEKTKLLENYRIETARKWQKRLDFQNKKIKKELLNTVSIAHSKYSKDVITTDISSKTEHELDSGLNNANVGERLNTNKDKELEKNPHLYLIEQCAEDIGLFASFFLEHHVTKPFSKRFHIQLFKDLYELATGVSRENKDNEEGVDEERNTEDSLSQTPEKLSQIVSQGVEKLSQDLSQTVDLSQNLSQMSQDVSHASAGDRECHTPYTDNSSPNEEAYKKNKSQIQSNINNAESNQSNQSDKKGGWDAQSPLNISPSIETNFATNLDSNAEHNKREGKNNFASDLNDNASSQVDRKKKRLVVAAPRGCAKSTLVAEVFVLWCVCYRVRDFVLIVSDTEDQAKMRLETIKGELEGNDRLREVYGDLVGEVWGALEVETRNRVKIIVKGTGQKVRGMKYGNRRPGLVVCHAPGTEIEDFELGKMLVEEHPSAKRIVADRVKVSLRSLENDEIVSEDHLYWCKRGKEEEPEWIKAKDILPGYFIGDPYEPGGEERIHASLAGRKPGAAEDKKQDIE